MLDCGIAPHHALGCSEADYLASDLAAWVAHELPLMHQADVKARREETDRARAEVDKARAKMRRR